MRDDCTTARRLVEADDPTDVADAYVPATEDIALAWARDRRDWIGAEFIQPQFNRWLREVRRLAWEEGFEGGRGFDVQNPYEGSEADRG